MHDCLLVVVYRIAFWDRDRVRIGICHSLVFVWILYLVMDDRRGTKVQCILACSLNLVLVFFCLVSRLGSGEWKWKLCMNCTEDWYREEQVMGLDWIGLDDTMMSLRQQDWWREGGRKMPRGREAAEGAGNEI